MPLRLQDRALGTVPRGGNTSLTSVRLHLEPLENIAVNDQGLLHLAANSAGLCTAHRGWLVPAPRSPWSSRWWPGGDPVLAHTQAQHFAASRPLRQAKKALDITALALVNQMVIQTGQSRTPRMPLWLQGRAPGDAGHGAKRRPASGPPATSATG